MLVVPSTVLLEDLPVGTVTADHGQAGARPMTVASEKSHAAQAPQTDYKRI